jgi:GNAT superfamily N-acetyltransferase
MLRPAVPADLARLRAIRDVAGVDALSDPALIADAELNRLIAAGAVTVWKEDARLVGFAALDGPAIHLLVDTTHRGKGVGRDLLADACARASEGGHAAAILALAPGSAAQHHYLAAGWTIVRREASGRLVLQKSL